MAASLTPTHPLGIPSALGKRGILPKLFSLREWLPMRWKPGFTYLSPTEKALANPLPWLLRLWRRRGKEPLLLHLETDWARWFPLAYDFVDGFVLHVPLFPSWSAEKTVRHTEATTLTENSADGNSPTAEGMSAMVDELLHIRKSYESYVPIFLRIPVEATLEEVGRALDYCLLSGIDGVAVQGERAIRRIAQSVAGSRLCILGIAEAPATLRSVQGCLEAGATLVETGASLHEARRLHRKLFKHDRGREEKKGMENDA